MPTGNLEKLFEYCDRTTNTMCIPDFVTFSEAGENIDVVIRSNVEDHKLVIKILQQFPSEVSKKFNFIYEPTGPGQDFLSAFDLVLIPKKEKKINQVEDLSQSAKDAVEIKPGKLFTPMKTKSSYHDGSFFDVHSAWDFWAKEVTKPLIVEPKYSGVRLTIHKKGKRVWLFVENKKYDKSSVLPQVVEEVSKLDGDFIIDSKALLWDGEGQLISSDEIMRLVAGKQPIEEKIILNCFDILYLNTSLINESLSIRKAILERLLASGSFLKLVEYRKVDDKLRFEQAVKWATSVEESDGGVFKEWDSKYGLLDTWPKIENIGEMNAKVIGKFQLDGIFNYRVAFNGGIIEDRGRVTSKDLKNWKMLKGYRHHKKSEYAYGVTQDTSVDVELGDNISIKMAKIDSWVGEDNKEHFSWHYPSVGGVVTQLDNRSDIDKLVAATNQRSIRMEFQEDRSEYDGKAISPALGLSGERQRELVKSIQYDPYVVETDKPARYTVMQHIRGILSQKQHTNLLNVLSSEIDEEFLGTDFNSLYVALGNIHEYSKAIRYSDLINQFNRINMSPNLDAFRLHEFNYSFNDFPSSKVFLDYWVESYTSSITELQDFSEEFLSSSNEDREQKAFERLWRKYGLVYLDIPVEELKEKTFDLTGEELEQTLNKYLHTKPIKVSDFEEFRSKIYNRGNSHLDLRMTVPGKKYLIGWTLLTGLSVLQSFEDPNKIISLTKDKFQEGEDNIGCIQKDVHPSAWLTIVNPSRKVYNIEPGFMGATGNFGAKFVYVSGGQLRYGKNETDYHEYFLDEDQWEIRKIKGKKDYTRIPEVFWMMEKP